MKQQQQHEVQCLQTAAAMTELWQLQLFSPVRPRPRLTHTTKKLFPHPSADLQDEAERIHESNAEEDVIDLPEQERKCTQGLVSVIVIILH